VMPTGDHEWAQTVNTAF